jgi:hypothetical protein
VNSISLVENSQPLFYAFKYKYIKKQIKKDISRP